MITGYSFGSLIAIELARKFEAEGLTGRLILIDGAPELMKAIKDQHLTASNNEELETNVLLGIMDNLVPASSDSSEVNTLIFIFKFQHANNNPKFFCHIIASHWIKTMHILARKIGQIYSKHTPWNFSNFR